MDQQINTTMKSISFLSSLLLIISSLQSYTQEEFNTYFSIGGRSTMSMFSHESAGGLGLGGQFRIKPSENINTEWFADYIQINNHGYLSEYYHIGWSVLYYPLKSQKIQPYILVGHCFDFNRIVFNDGSFEESRWGSAVQGGIGTHFNITNRFDISLMSQFMIHLTEEIEVPNQHHHANIESHVLNTISFNYKLFELW